MPSFELLAFRVWHNDAGLSRRRSVLFAFTFSPPAQQR